MSGKMKKILAVALSAAVAVTFIPCTAFASSGKISNAQAKKLYEKYKSEKTDIFDFADQDTRNEIKTEAEEYPEAFDLSDGRITGLEDAKNIITPVKLQNPFGTCWAFAATAAAEGSVTGEKKDKGEAVDVRDSRYDFSEKHLAWFTSQYLNDPDSSQYGEGIHWKEGMTGSEKLDAGGLPFYATQQYSSGIGPNLESDFPYRGKNGSINKLKDGNRLVKFCYSEDDDWSIDESWRYYQNYQLEESYMLPSPAGKDDDGNYKYNEAATDAIKDQLLQKRPVEIGFYADVSSPNEEGECIYINQNTWAHYTYEQEEANHAVCVVGYDDNYSKENFNKDNRPPADGAFLVKNSWGSGEEEFPNNSGPGRDWGVMINGKSTGYFWISYYDQTISLVEALNFNTEGVEEYYVDEYDFMPLEEPQADSGKEPASMANVFTAEVSMKLSALSCQTSTPGTEVDYKVYLLTDDAEEPEDGVLVYEGKESYQYGGFHKHDIKDGPIVQKGQKYSVVITQTDPNGEYVVMMNCSYGKFVAELFDYSSWCEAVVNKGESYLKEEDSWSDLHSILKDELLEQTDIIEFDNYPIKAYGDEIDQTCIKISGDLTTDSDEGVIDTKVNFSGTGNTEYIDNIVWKSSDESVATVQALDNDSKAKITVKDFGFSYITASEESLGTSVAKLKVCPYEVECYAKGSKKSMKVNWDISNNCHGYTIKYKKTGGKWKTMNKGRATDHVKIKKLSKGKYKVKVAPYAKNRAGRKIYAEYSNTCTVNVR